MADRMRDRWRERFRGHRGERSDRDQDYSYWDFDGHNYRFGPQGRHREEYPDWDRGQGYGEESGRSYGWDFRPDFLAGRRAWEGIHFGPDEDRGRRLRERGHYAGIGPKGYRRSDERLTEDVCDRLAAHPDIDPSEIEIDVKDGHVTLRGEVDDRWDKRLAEDIAYATTGVKDVRNELRIGRQRRENERGSQAA